MSRAELKSRSTPAPVAGIERISRARFVRAGYLCWFSFQNVRGETLIVSEDNY